MLNIDESKISLPNDFKLHSFASLVSTNDEAVIMANEGASDGTIIYAGEQKSGRGRLSRNWVSPRGNLYLSVILRNIGQMVNVAQLSFITAVAMADAIAEFLPKPDSIKLKWPNDILINNAKFCGILLECGMDKSGHNWVVIGTGVNINSHPQDVMYQTTDLHQENCHVSIEELLVKYIQKLSQWRDRWLSYGFAPIRAAWLNKAARLGEIIKVNLPNDIKIEGIFRGMNLFGEIEIIMADGNIKMVNAGDIFFE